MRRLLPLAALALLVPLLPGAAHADPAPAAPAAPTSYAARPDPDVDLTRFRFRDVVMDRRTTDGASWFNRVAGRVGTTFAPGSGYQPVANAVTARLRVNGGAPADPAFTHVGLSFLDGGQERVGTLVPHSLGPGRYVVGPVNLAITTDDGDRDVVFARTDAFFVRQPTVARLTGSRSGGRVTLRVTAQVRRWQTWTLVRVAPRARVERRTRSGWRLVARVPLSGAGKGTVVVRSGEARRYRVRIAQTATRVGRVAATGPV